MENTTVNLKTWKIDKFGDPVRDQSSNLHLNFEILQIQILWTLNIDDSYEFPSIFRNSIVTQSWAVQDLLLPKTCC